MGGAAGAGKPARAARVKEAIPIEGLAARVPALLEEIQRDMLERARAWRDRWTRPVDDWDDFRRQVEAGGFVLAHWCGDAACEAAIKAETTATIRVIVMDEARESGACVRCGKPSSRRVHFAVAY